MEITIALENDLPFILALQKECYLAEAELYNDYSIPPVTQTLDSIKEDFKKELFLKAIEGNQIIGSVKAFQKNNTCFIGRLMVDKNYQNKGIGASLMKNIETRFDRAERFELFTGYLSTKNISLYKKLGYTEFKIEKINEKVQFVFLEKFSKR